MRYAFIFQAILNVLNQSFDFCFLLSIFFRVLPLGEIKMYIKEVSNAQYTPPTPTRRNCFVASASAV